MLRTPFSHVVLAYLVKTEQYNEKSLTFNRERKINFVNWLKVSLGFDLNCIFTSHINLLHEKSIDFLSL